MSFALAFRQTGTAMARTRRGTMAKERHKDFITEEDYTIEMAGHVSTNPESDSPGDSELDADKEVSMGLSFETDADIDENDIDLAEGLVTTTSTLRELPETAEVVNSEMPSPRRDQDSDTAIH
jgi:hypothetical protein